MAQKLYECMFLLDSGKWATDSQGTEGSVRDILSRCEAEIVATSPFQEGRLAYEIAGQRKGLHLLTYFKMDGSQVPEMTRLCKLNKVILRHLLISHPKKLFDLMTDALLKHTEGAEEAAAAAT